MTAAMPAVVVSAPEKFVTVPAAFIANITLVIGVVLIGVGVGVVLVLTHLADQTRVVRVPGSRTPETTFTRERVALQAAAHRARLQLVRAAHEALTETDAARRS